MLAVAFSGRGLGPFPVTTGALSYRDGGFWFAEASRQTNGLWGPEIDMQVPLTLLDGFANRSEGRPRALDTLRDRGLIWRACLAFCFAFWIAVAFGIYALVS